MKYKFSQTTYITNNTTACRMMDGWTVGYEPVVHTAVGIIHIQNIFTYLHLQPDLRESVHHFTHGWLSCHVKWNNTDNLLPPLAINISCISYLRVKVSLCVCFFVLCVIVLSCTFSSSILPWVRTHAQLPQPLPDMSLSLFAIGPFL